MAKALALLLLSFSIVYSQTEKGTILGTVTDAAGAVIPSAKVTVANMDTNVGVVLMTNAVGQYEVPFQSPGRYSVTVSVSGFKTGVVQDIVLHVGERARADVVLNVGAVESRVEVTAQEPLVQTDAATVGQVIENHSIVNLPNADRNIYSFIQLNSNVTAPPGGNAPAFRLESGGSLAISGGRPSSVTFKIDGLSNTDPAFGTPTITPSLDSVQEFKVQNMAFDAQYAGIGQINVATKSGSNAVHGSAFDFFRNDALQPRNPIAPLDSSGKPGKSKLRFNQFGGTLGGPVVIPHIYSGKDKTFFFFSYEGRRWNSTAIGGTLVPTEAQRNGDFASALGACATTKSGADTVPIPLLAASGDPTRQCVRVGQIFDPRTTILNPKFNASQPASILNPQYIRQPFQNNRIPSELISPITNGVIAAQLPLPNNPGNPESNFIGSAGTVFDYNQYSGRIDHNFSERDTIYGRVAFQDNVRLNQPLIPWTTKNLTNDGRVFTATWTHTFSPAFVNEFRLGYVRGIYGDSVDPVDPVAFGFKNTFNTLLPQMRLTARNITWGGWAGSILAEVQNTYQLADNVSFVRGKHGLRFGFAIDHNRFKNGELGNNSGGTAIFSGIYTSAYPLVTATFENSLADFLMGNAQNSTLGVPSIANLRNTPWSLYVQDDWKLASWITVNVGLRYELHQPYRENLLGGATFDYQDGGHIVVANPEAARLANTPLVRCCTDPRVVPTDRNDFAPRIGIAIRPFGGNDFAIRAGYGIFYSDQTQFFHWRQYEPAVVQTFNGLNGDFANIGAHIDNLFPASQFTTSGLYAPSFPAGVNRAVLNNQPIVGTSALGSYKTPYSQQWSLSIQKSFWRDFLVDVSYTGSNSKNLPTQWIFNQPSASPVPIDLQSTDPAANPYLRRPYPNLSPSSFVVANILQSNYNAATVKLEKRFSSGFSFLTSYTWSKAIDQGSEVFALVNTFNILSDNRNINRDRGLATFDIPHRWVTSGVFELPFGHGKRLLNQAGWVDKVIGGWQVSGILQVQSGYPFTPLIRNRLSNTGYSLATERGDLVGDPYWSSDEWERRVKEWETKDVRLYVINPNSIDLNYAPGTFGNIPRNFFRAPYGRDLSMSLGKNTRIGERAGITLRADVYNMTEERLHRLDLASSVAANNLLTNPLVGSIPERKFFFNPRTIQLSLRLAF